MNYWAIHSTAAAEAAMPLLSFIEGLAEEGKKTARDLYGINIPGAWVAHGFTDSSMEAGVLGEIQWAYCVSCGAWMALTAWEVGMLLPQ